MSKVKSIKRSLRGPCDAMGRRDVLLMQDDGLPFEEAPKSYISVLSEEQCFTGEGDLDQDAIHG